MFDEKLFKSYCTEHYVPILRDKTKDIFIKCVKTYNPKSVLEIGTAIGYSGSLILNNCDAFLTTIEKDENTFNIAKFNFEKLQINGRVVQLLGDAYDYLVELNNQHFKYDFIFLDGPKGQYIKYLPLIKNLLNKGGVLFTDNVFYRGMVLGKVETPKKKRTIVNNLRKFIFDITHDNSFNTQLYDIEDGIAISIKLD